MSGSFDRSRLPSWPEYAAAEGLTLHGRGRWRNVLCDFHDDRRPSMRVNVESGGWVCMSCGVKGGDTVSHYMRRNGVPFMDAARALGAVDGTGEPRRPRRFSASDALGCIEIELNVCAVIISDARAGVLPSEADWKRFLAAVRVVVGIAQEARA